MATIPWTSASAPSATGVDSEAVPGTEAVVMMASRFVVRSRMRHTVPMLRHALKVRAAMLSAPGALGLSVAARPLRGEYWTLSSWADRASLDAFVATAEHRAAMRALGPAMADAVFVFWQQDAGAKPSWDDARARVAARRAADAGKASARQATA